MNHMIIFAAWAVYFAFHSLLITDWIKNRVVKSGISLHTWRVIYMVFSTVGFCGMLYFLAAVESDLLWIRNRWTQFIGMALTTYGVIVIRISFRNYSLREFLMKDRTFEKLPLIRKGIHAKVRHPLYSGTILIVVGMLFFIPKFSVLITVVALLLYLLIGIQLEEKKLIRQFGEQYRLYQKEVPMLIPKLFNRSDQ